ncbi:MAG: TetR family transcriptional regulator [Mycobacterium sp.]|jgi:hypothetical protein|nr:TetR family transcriptional regulator [Mycobacterium sp.]
MRCAGTLRLLAYVGTTGIQEFEGAALRAVWRPEEDRPNMAGAAEVNMLLNRNAAALLGECGQFLAPYLAAAKLTGEVRRTLDVDAAAEWFARMLFSLFMTPSARLDPNDAAAVTAFVREHVVRGFVGPGPARRRQTP